MKQIRPFIIFILFSFGFVAASFSAPPVKSAELYRKHCSACHNDSSRLRSTKDLVSLMRNPPSHMPAFSEDKLSDMDAKAIAEYINPAAPVAPAAQKAPRALPGTSLTVPAAPAPPAFSSVSFKIVPEKMLKPIKLPHDDGSKLRSFVKSWALLREAKGDDLMPIQHFDISANENDELNLKFPMNSADYSATVTVFEIADRTLKLQLKWKIKDAPSYKKIETYELTLSEDGRNLTGFYNQQTIDGLDLTRAVWGE